MNLPSGHTYEFRGPWTSQPHRLYPPDHFVYRTLGEKHYELNDHLGNVRATVTDRKIAEFEDAGTDWSIVGFSADITSAQDYYPGGMLMPGRQFNPDKYEYGFNGMMMDNEMKGVGNSYTTFFRQYDPRLVRWFSTDPKEFLFPSQSPYAAFDNNPIVKTDPQGDCTICDQLRKHGVITGRGFYNRDHINVKENTTVSDVEYSSSGISVVKLWGIEPYIRSVSETITTSTLKFSETKDQAYITKVTTETVVEISGNKVKSTTVTTKTERMTLGVSKTKFFGTLQLDFDIPLVDRVHTSTDTETVNEGSMSPDLSKRVDQAKEHNMSATDKNADKVYEWYLEDGVKDNLENSKDPGVMHPSGDKTKK